MQCGVPEDVYERPEEPFVAGFIGISNLIEGTVVDPGTVELTSGVRVPAPLPGECSTGDRIAVRPEKIAIDQLEPGMVELEGTVEQRVYQGMTTQITIALGGDARLVALEQNTYRARADDRWEEGHRLRIGWHPEHCLVLR
jgi:spermidine/putrescine transport system ATP-binding protein